MSKVRSLFVLTIGIALLASPAFALFDNGGFEDGTTSSWTVEGGQTVTGGVGGLDDITWGAAYAPIVSVIDSTYNDPYSTFDSPFYGDYMVKINDAGGGWDATRLSQTGTVAAGDIGIDSKFHLYFSWGAVLQEPTNIHPTSDQPFFDITVKANGTTVYNEFLSADMGATAGWTSDTASWWYNLATIDLDTIVLGDSIEVLLTAVDCGWGGHGGYAYLDGFGSTYIPPIGNNPVPEPSTFLLLSGGLAGLAFYARRRRKE